MTRISSLFSYLAALRMIAPAYIATAGHFQFGGIDNPFKEPTLLSLHTRWQPDPSHRYSAADIMRAGQLHDRIGEHVTMGPTRLRNALLLFTQVTNGYSLSYQMSILGLYSALESLFVPSRGDGNYAQTLGKRVELFLSNYSRGVDLCGRIAKHYKDERHPLSHGYWQLSPSQDIAKKRQDDFGILHEALRLSLLGFLSMDKRRLSFLEKNGRALGHALDTLAPAQGSYLTGQKMWLT